MSEKHKDDEGSYVDHMAYQGSANPRDLGIQNAESSDDGVAEVGGKNCKDELAAECRVRRLQLNDEQATYRRHNAADGNDLIRAGTKCIDPRFSTDRGTLIAFETPMRECAKP